MIEQTEKWSGDFGREYTLRNPQSLEKMEALYLKNYIIPCCGDKEFLWKKNFSRKYLNLFDDLTLVKEEGINYFENENIDAMFLLEKMA